MSFKPIDDRQVINRAALTNIGSVAGDSLDDILAKINALFSTITSPPYISKNVALSAGATSYVVTMPSQPDLSYLALAMLNNTVDANPKFQQVEVTNKTTTGFTVQWNAPLDTANYSLDYIVPPLSVIKKEAPIGSGVTSVNVPLSTSLNGPSYGIVGLLQNLVDTNPQYQTTVITSQNPSNFVSSFNAPTSSANYTYDFLEGPTGQVSVPINATSITATLPIPYGSSNYTVVAVLSNASSVNSPTVQRFTATGSGTYTTPAGVSYIQVRMVAPGGGGGSSGGNVGFNGAGTTFGTSLLMANGGFGGQSNVSGGAGAGGSPGTVNSPAITVVNVGGGGGQCGSAVSGDVAGGIGGNSFYGGSGRGGAPTALGGSAGDTAADNSGSGGGGGGAAGGGSGSGGGAGGYIEAIIVSPSATYPYAIGLRGGGGAAGAGYGGGDGGSGYIEVTEYYNGTSVSDSYPKFQPLLVTAKNSSQFTVSVNTPVPTSNYLLTYYALSFSA